MNPPNVFAKQHPFQRKLGGFAGRGWMVVGLIVPLLSACATTTLPTPSALTLPDTLALPAQWSSLPASAQAAAPPSASTTPWWQSLTDDTLKSLITTALNHAPDVRTAIINVQRSRSSEAVTNAGFFPDINASLSTSRQASGGNRLSAAQVYQGSIDASWELPLWNGQWQNAAAAQYDVWRQEYGLAQAQVTLVAEVASQYIQLRAAQWKLMSTQNNLAKQEESLRITEFKVQAGLVEQLAAEQARANVAQARAALPDFALAERSAIRHLAVLMGQPPQALFAELAMRKTAAIELPALPSTFSLSIPMNTLQQRPDVRAAEATFLAEQYRATAQDRQRFPSLSLAGSWSWQSLTLASLGGSANLLRTALAKISTSLFDGGALKARADGQALVAQAAWVSYEKTLLLALEEVENNVDAVAQAQLKVDAWVEAERATRSANDLARAQYQVGLLPYTTLLDSDQAQLNAENNAVQAKANQWLAHIALYKALAGDWQSLPATDALATAALVH